MIAPKLVQLLLEKVHSRPTSRDDRFWQIVPSITYSCTKSISLNHNDIYRVAQNWHHILYVLTLPNINRFSKLFHHQNQELICNNTITKDPTTPQVCHYPTL